MILVTAGDSWTQGDSPAQTINWEATKSLDWYDVPENFSDPYNPCDNRIRYKFYDSEIWPKVLGRNFNVETWNVGRLGSDNYNIVRRTINTVEELLTKGKKDIKVVVGWSSMLRIPIFAYKDNRKELLFLEQVRPMDDNKVMQAVYKNPEIYEDAYALCILTLQNYLDSKDIDYRFFQAFDPFKNFYSNTYSNLIKIDKWIDKDPTVDHFKQFIFNKFNIDRDMWGNEGRYFRIGHPTDISHIEWGNHLYNKLKDDWS